MSNEVKELCLCGVLTGLAVVLLVLGGIIPMAMYASPMLASLAVAVAGIECRRSYAWSLYAASSMLAILLCPDKECSLLFCLLGYYPLVVPAINRIKSKLIRLIIKLSIFSLAISLMYALVLLLISAPETETLAAVGDILLFITIAMGVFAFLVYDMALERLTRIYKYKRGI